MDWGEDFERVVPRLVELMRAGLDVGEPNASMMKRRGARGLFEGSYDYHSCIAAHWALLVIARVEGDEGLEADVLGRLTPEGLEAERALLAGQERPLFTFPYEHAWLCLLLSELERREGRATAELRAFRLEVEGRLLAHLADADFPEHVPPAERGGRPYNGFYRSWMFAWLQLASSRPVTEGAMERLKELYERRLRPHREAIAALEDAHPFDFLWVPSVLALIERTGDVCTDPLEYDPADVPELPEAVTLSTVHVLGTELSRVWPCALLAHSGEIGPRRTYEARIGEFLARRDLWEEDFQVVTHWVPQFLWYGMWLRRGRP